MTSVSAVKRARTRLGRPLSNENRLNALAERARSPVIRILLEEAANRGLSVEELIGKRRLNCARKTLHCYLETAQPRLRTVEAICNALGHKSLVARALLRQLTTADRNNIQTAIGLDFGAIPINALFTDSERVRRLVADGLASLPEVDRDEAFARYLLARSGLIKGGVASGFPPEIEQLDNALQRTGHGFRRFARKITSDREQNALALLNAAYLQMGLGRADRARITDLIRPRMPALFRELSPDVNKTTEQWAETHFIISEKVDAVLKTLENMERHK
jgi:hypothetical protein